MAERFRYPISSHVTGAFYPFAVRRDCPGASLVLAIRFPFGGESYVVCATASNSPRSRAFSSCVYLRALRMLSHLFTAFRPWEGPRPTNYRSIVIIISSGVWMSVNCVTILHSGPDNFINRLPWRSRSFRDSLRGH